MAESYEVSKAVAVVLALRIYMGEIGIPQLEASVIRCDNARSVHAAESSTSDKQGLFMKRRIKFTRDAQDDKHVKVVYFSNTVNYADILTKMLGPSVFRRWCSIVMRQD